MDPVSIAHALRRAQQVLTRKPELARHEDVPARAVHAGGLRTDIESPLGAVLSTDLGPTLGGEGAGVPPGWLMRAGLASCLCTAVAMHAARRGIELRRLEVQALSHSDARGLLEIEPAVSPGPLELTLEVRIEADGVDAASLRELVTWSDAHSPVSDAMHRSLDVQLRIDTGAG